MPGIKLAKNAIRFVWAMIPLPIKIAIIVVLIIIIVIFAFMIEVLGYSAVNESTSSVSNYVSSSIPETTEAGQLFKQTNSLLLVEDADISKMSETFIKDVELTDHNLYLLMNKEYGTASKADNTAVSLNEKKTIYEHLLNAEKYNFNKIRWVKYTRSAEDGTPTLKVDSATKLQYPEDSKGTTLKTFANMTQPYLQHYIVPYSLYVGLISDSRIMQRIEEDRSAKELKFAYAMLENTYHDIQVNQYNKKSYTKVTEDTVYDLFNVTVKHSITVDDSGNTTPGNYVPTISLAQSCAHENSSPKVISSTENWDVIYRIKSAKMFDKEIINEYLYTEYNLNNEPDDQSISRVQYKDYNYEVYEAGNYDIPDSYYNFKYTDSGTIAAGTYTATYTFQAKKGYIDTTVSTWKDTLEQMSHEERAYTAQDVQNALGATSLSSEEKKYYEQYEYNSQKGTYGDRLTLFDIANSKKDVYTNYLRDGEEYSDNIGYARSYLVFSFDVMEKGIGDIVSSEGGWKYFYGSSVGASEATSVSTSNTSSLISVDYSSLPDGKLGWPSPGHTTITSGFGKRAGDNHMGIDISMPSGSTFVAAAPGTVIEAQTTCTDNEAKASRVEDLGPANSYCGGGAGNYVKIKVDGTEMYLIYMHMSEVTVKKGDNVTAGQAIGTSGSTGRSTGPHAHFEVRIGADRQANAIDPEPILEKPS